jgi:hypothetical protein
MDNDEATFSFNLGSAIDTLASIETAAQSVLEDAAKLMTGDITKVAVTIPLDISGWTLVPAVGAPTDRLVGGRAVFGTTSNPNVKVEINLPTFDTETFVPTPGNEVNQAAQAVIDFYAACQGTTLTNSSDIEVSLLRSFKETFGGKSR